MTTLPLADLAHESYSSHAHRFTMINIVTIHLVTDVTDITEDRPMQHLSVMIVVWTMTGRKPVVSAGGGTRHISDWSEMSPTNIGFPVELALGPGELG